MNSKRSRINDLRRDTRAVAGDPNRHFLHRNQTDPDGYREAERALAFTPMMMIERLALGLLASVASGGLARLVSGPGSPAPWITGFVLLVFFVPVHIDLWGRFPLAYHLFFLASIATVPSLAARFMGRAA